MTSLKNLHANEIAENLAKLLGNDDFMSIHRTASLKVEAEEAPEKEEMANDAADCQHNADGTVCQECACGDAPESDAEDMMVDDPSVTVALNFAIDNMVKIADALDNKGFSGVATMIDSTIEKLAKKKGKLPPWLEKGKGKGSEKDDKESKKDSKKDDKKSKKDDKKDDKKSKKDSKKDDKESK